MKSRSVRHRRGGSHGSRRKGFRGGTVCTGVNGGGRHGAGAILGGRRSRRGGGEKGVFFKSGTPNGPAWSGGSGSRRVRRGGRDNNMESTLLATPNVNPGQMRGGGEVRPAVCGLGGWNDC